MKRSYEHPHYEPTQCRYIYSAGDDGIERGAYAYCTNERERHQSYCTHHMNRSRRPHIDINVKDILHHAQNSQ